MYGFLILLVCFFFSGAAGAAAAASFPDRFTSSPSRLRHKSKEYFELGQPLPSDPLPSSCSRHVITHSFANTINGRPFSAPYSSPYPPSDESSIDCSAPWSHVALEFRAKCRGEQYDRIAAVWLGGVELLRTSTAEPNEEGIFWKVRKDITRYSSLLSRSDLNVTMMLENVVDRVFTGVYHVDVRFLYYKRDAAAAVANPRISSILENRRLITAAEEEPADLIIPISDDAGEDRGFWFRISGESDFPAKQIRIQKNTRRVVLELYMSFHGDDEFWYSNPPNVYITTNNLTTRRGNGAYREVFVTVDGELVGSEVPFPVVFTGGINPLFWEPVVAIGAFDLPTYDFELTPFLGKLLDMKPHTFRIGVTDGISYWLVNANLHIWLDHKSKTVQANSVFVPSPKIQVKRNGEFEMLDGSFDIKVKRRTDFVGWLKSSAGNHTTLFSQKYKFSSSVSFKKDGTHKTVNQWVKADREVRVLGEDGKVVYRTRAKRWYPIDVVTATLPGKKKGTYVLVTNVTHSMKEKIWQGGSLSRIKNVQDSKGWMEVRDHDVLSGSADTQQSFGFKDELGCYSRAIDVVNGSLISDNFSFHCLSAA